MAVEGGDAASLDWNKGTRDWGAQTMGGTTLVVGGVRG